MTEKKQKLVLLSAGGTGGHVFPAAALAEDLLARGYKVAFATDSRAMRYIHHFGDVPVHVLPSGTLGAGVMGKFKGMLALGIGIIKAFALLNKIKPDVVVGFGGYPSVPAVLAAQRKHIPTVIHEQNAILGKANELLSRKADRIALSLSHMQGIDEADMVRAIVTGNPVRSEVAALYSKPYPALDHDSKFKIAVLGGSQAAGVFSEVLPKAFARLPAEYRARLELVQQSVAEDVDMLRARYEELGIVARIENFFDDVPDILSSAHLVIARSGASTVAEVTTAGRPAVFVPYPYHKDQQQKINADVVADAGGAWVMTQDGFTPEAVLQRLEILMQSPEKLFDAAENARSCARPDAARRLGNLVTALASGWDKQAARAYDLTQGLDG